MTVTGLILLGGAIILVGLVITLADLVDVLWPGEDGDGQ